MNTEADTCRKFVVLRLQTAGLEGASHAINDQRTFTDDDVVSAIIAFDETQLHLPSTETVAPLTKTEMMVRRSSRCT